MDFQKLESKWQRKWAKAKVFEREPDKRKKFFNTFIIAYPSGDLHIGHARTFTRSDVISRYKNLCGFNSLATTGFHATGSRAVVMAKRIAERDPKTIQILRNMYNLSEKQIKQFANKPEAIVRFFAKSGTSTLQKGGASIDWRRNFTTIDPQFKKLIDWQFRLLRAKGYVSKGSHPVIYCPHCQSPITQADRDEGEDAIVQEFSIWKYPMEDGTILPAATLRPETIFAITNMFVNPNAEYVIARIGKERWILGKAAGQLLAQQRKDVQILNNISPNEIIGKKFSNPITGEKGLLVLPGTFVNPEHSTGVVVSEPSDSPDDHIALEELKRDRKYLERFNLKPSDIERIKYKPLITVKGYGKFPAVEICERMNIITLCDPKLLSAKKEMYKLQYHQGHMAKIAGDLEGKTIPQAIAAVKRKYKRQMDAMYAPSEKVVCKCGSTCYVKLLENQWFINYGDPKWKAQVKKHLDSMQILPEVWRKKFDAGLDWTANKACVRRSGLGVHLPWDKSWTIETLSDSTIYMCYYSISKFIKANNLRAAQMTDGFFNYVLLNKGDASKVSRETGLKVGLLNKIRKEFNYWYPVDWRNSGKDLVTNHLLYYIYNHIAIFPKSKWPMTISVNGFVKLGKEKMSKSKGRSITFETAINEYGADVTRTVSVTAAGPEQDSEFSLKEVANMIKWQVRFEDIIKKIAHTKKYKPETHLDQWLLSRTMQVIDNTAKNLEVLNTREASQYCIHQMMANMRWYMRRSNGNFSRTSKEIAKAWVIIVSPYMPHICEELWQILGGKGFVSNAQWPIIDKRKINAKAEQAEAAIAKVAEDIRHIAQLVKKMPKSIYIYVIPPELSSFKAAEEFLSAQFKAKVSIFAVNDPNKYDPQGKAKMAKPGRPAIYLE